MFQSVHILLLLLASTHGFGQFLTSDRVHFTTKSHADPFLTLSSDSLKDCINECKLRKKCKHIKFKRFFRRCYLLEVDSSEANTEESVGYIYGSKSEWNLESFDACDTCNNNEACQILNSIPVCEIKECAVPEAINRTKVLGNMCSVGSKVCYKCNGGLDNIESDKKPCSTCLPDGTWSPVTITCNCSTGWEEREEHCYLFVTEERLNWTEAERNCNKQGGHLVKIENEGEDVFLRERFETGFNNSFWTGGIDNDEDGIFAWQDGTPFGDYINWNDDPNRIQPEDPTAGEHCLMNNKLHFKWHDANCSDTFKSVCEKP